MPDKPGVYLMKDDLGTILYIGKAKRLKLRIRQYALQQDSREIIPLLIQQVSRIEWMITTSEKEALLLEAQLIKTHQPKYNVLLKDDKAFLGIAIDKKERIPKIQLVRSKKELSSSIAYFGPYLSSLTARALLESITKLFQLRRCSDREFQSRKHPCIFHSLHRCHAPCVGKISEEDYRKQVLSAIQLLKGNQAELKEQLKEQMEAAAKRLDYEKADEYLRILNDLEEESLKQKFPLLRTSEDLDIVACAQDSNSILILFLHFRGGGFLGSTHLEKELFFGSKEEVLETTLMQYLESQDKPPKEICVPFSLPTSSSIEELFNCKIAIPEKKNKRELLEIAQENALSLLPKKMERTDSLLVDIQHQFRLKKIPLLIECFDISHLSGSDTVGSSVVFVNGDYSGKDSRIYRLEQTGGDDYAAIQELLKRRLSKGTPPDLIVIDGGIGHLHAAEKILQELGLEEKVDLISISKEEGRHDKGLRKEKVHLSKIKEPIELSQGTLLFFLQRLRDEAHRKALHYQKKIREKKSKQSALETLPGIGRIKSQRLLSKFKSLAAIQSASDEELLSVPGINKTNIAAIRLYST